MVEGAKNPVKSLTLIRYAPPRPAGLLHARTAENIP